LALHLTVGLFGCVNQDYWTFLFTEAAKCPDQDFGITPNQIFNVRWAAQRLSMAVDA
jgi:hypothetical protein